MILTPCKPFRAQRCLFWQTSLFDIHIVDKCALTKHALLRKLRRFSVFHLSRYLLTISNTSYTSGFSLVQYIFSSLAAQQELLVLDPSILPTRTFCLYSHNDRSWSTVPALLGMFSRQALPSFTCSLVHRHHYFIPYGFFLRFYSCAFAYAPLPRRR